MFKKQLCLLAALVLLTSLMFTSGAFALNYSGSQGNEAAIETLEETRASSPAAVANLETNVGKAFKSHPVLDGYPQGTTYVYRSANLFGGRAAARLNTDILVFAEQAFGSKDEALSYLNGLGLIDIIDQAVGSVILVTPSDPKAGFTAGDQKNYYKLQTAMLAQKASETAGDVTTYYSDAEYFGGYGYTYVIGLDGGATFLNNYVAGTLDYVGRIAGMLLIGGKMEDIRNVASLVPVYLVNASDSVIEKYKKANNADSYMSENGLDTYFNQAFSLQKVVVAKNESPDAAGYIKDAYNSLFIKAMRVPVLKQGLYTASTPYQGYGFDQAPYSLCERNAIINGVTGDGITLTRHDEETFSDLKMKNGEYLQTWFEYLPKEVLDGTAPKGSVPLFLANHGGGDDPRVFVDEIGLLSLAGKERFAIVAPEEQNLWQEKVGDKMVNGICCEILPRIAKYMLDTYPALDPSRVYVTGYSMGGGATLKTINGDPAMFAAGIVMAASSYVATEEQAKAFEKVDLPIMLTTSTYDMPAVGAFDTENMTIAAGFQKQINLFCGYNGMKKIDAFDFATYPIIGCKVDRFEHVKVNNEYWNYRWYLNNDAGIPMIAVSYTEGLVHALYPEYGKILWDFAKHYSRNQQTGAIEYDPYIQ
jgi:pimeloyl-ACP methyl ester carboxylesterase